MGKSSKGSSAAEYIICMFEGSRVGVKAYRGI
jgi:hypothetical protein